MANMMNQLELQFWNFLIPIKKKDVQKSSISQRRRRTIITKEIIFMTLSSSSLGLIIGVLVAILFRVF